MLSRSQRSEAARPAGASAPARLGFGDAPLARSTLALVGTGAAAGALFALTYLIEGVTRPGYDAWRQAISALSLGPGGWVQQVNFVVFGLLTILAAIGWRRALAPGAASVAYPALRVIEGGALMVDGFFSQDPAPGYPVGAALTAPTAHGIVHVVFAFIAITAIACGWFALARRFAREPRWRGWAAASVITGALSIVFISLFGAMGPHFAYDGVLERVATGMSSVLGIALVIRLLVMRRRVAMASGR